jgi:hypothetical protein
MKVIYGAYNPDQPASLNYSQDGGTLESGLAVADGVFPIANGYAPLPSFSGLQNGTLAARCIGAGGYRYTGSAYLFAATTTNIYTYSSAGYTSVASGLSGTQGIGVRFCAYNSFMLATNGVDPIKKFDPTSPTAMTNLGGTPPIARFMVVVRGFVVAGYTSGSSLRVQWSDTGNPAVWTTGGSSQAGLYDMPTGGDITGLVGGEYGTVFQEQRILRMTYTADDDVWQFDEVATDVGCIAPKSLATFGKITFFYSAKGFMAFDGVSVQAIGDEKVDRTFQAVLDATYFDSMSAVVDPRHSLYIVAIPSADPTSRVLIYNYAQQKWTAAAITTELLFSALSLSTSLEQLDAIYGNLDAIPISLDSNALRGGYPLLLLFNGSHALGSLSGANMAAIITDAVKELVPGRKSRISSIRPQTDASAPTVTVSGRNSLSDAPVSTDYTTRTGGGYFRMRENWNLSQTMLQIPAGATWTYVQGYDVEAVAGGRP